MYTSSNTKLFPSNSNLVGFDALFNELEKSFSGESKSSNYPPYNIIKIDDTKIVIQLAVTGVKKEDLKVYTEKQKLTIEGEPKFSIDKQESKDDISGINYVHRGLSQKPFKQTFKLAANLEVVESELKDGLLYIHLETIIPEKEKFKNINVR